MNAAGGSASSQLRSIPGLGMADNPILNSLLLKEAEIRNELQQGVRKPFSEIVFHSGDAQAMGQKPVTFLRQVLAICTYTKLFNNHTLPQDAKERAREILDNCEGKSIGSYTKSAGINCVRNHVARYLENRDGGITADPKNIYLISGTNISLTLVFKLLIDCRSPAKTGIMVPIPNSPLISESVSLLDGSVIHYSLDEEQAWSLDVVELRRALTKGRRHCVPRALCIVNPGNPTGHLLSRSCIESVIQFAAEERLFLLVDEAYQMNVYDKRSQFHSFKKILFEMGAKYSSTVELVSIFSISKGFIGEGGARGSVMELTNLDPEVQQRLGQLCDIYSCCSLTSQIAIDVATNPPQPGEASYPVYISVSDLPESQCLPDLKPNS